MTLWVRSLDRTYNGSEIARYDFNVKSTAPSISPAVTEPEFGQPTEFTLLPDPGLQAKSPVVCYSVTTIGGQNDRTFDITARPDGTATMEFALDGLCGENLQVTSQSANGWVSEGAWWGVSYDTHRLLGHLPGRRPGKRRRRAGHLHVHAQGEGRRELHVHLQQR